MLSFNILVGTEKGGETMGKWSIKKLRKYNDFTQKEMATKMGIAYSTYTQKEQGLIPWQISDFIIVKKLFDISIDELEEINQMMKELD